MRSGTRKVYTISYGVGTKDPKGKALESRPRERRAFISSFVFDLAAS
jgi:hypothetical protein